jgi:hypothetical protein
MNTLGTAGDSSDIQLSQVDTHDMLEEQTRTLLQDQGNQATALCS